MNMTETANFIEILEHLGWNEDQITKFQLGIEGRLTVEESVKQIQTIEKEKER